MLFNSLEFLIFLPVVFLVYWFVLSKKIPLQNLFVVVASYVFYGWWDPRFLCLIFFSTLVDYTVGLVLERNKRSRNRKLLVSLSLMVNLGLLGYFKYYNFFIESLEEALNGLFGRSFNLSTLNIILPVGISFYTFQTLSYTLDIYRRNMRATKDFVAFSAYVSFFPQLVAGPIERASHLLPQFFKKRTFSYKEATDGMRQILWGFFKKVVIADNCAVMANLIFNNSEDYGGSTLVLGAFFFAFQIYGDFSGYSDIAIGVSRLFGFDLMQNFAFPYFSRDIAEFWRRWHISLSTWFRDYLYIPLGGSRGGTAFKIRNTFIIFLVSGFWHGANWTFIIWGLLNAIYFLPLMLTNRNRSNMHVIARGRILPSFREALMMLLTFMLVTFSWIFFRAENLSHAVEYIMGIFSRSLFEMPEMLSLRKLATLLFIIGIFMSVEWFGRDNRYAIEKLGLSWHWLPRWIFYSFLVFMLGMFMRTDETPFIYFQF